MYASYVRYKLTSCILDPNGNVATWNAGAQAFKGYKPSEIIGRHFSNFYGEEDRANGKPERELRDGE
jgi:osomolarity two-component system sensor histidine kinase TcsA